MTAPGRRPPAALRTPTPQAPPRRESWQEASWRVAAATMTETGLMSEIRDMAGPLGWRIYHTHDSRRSDRGWPDLAMVNRKQGRLLIVELKNAKRKPTPEQIAWLRELHIAGQEAALWRPADLPDIALVLAGARITAEFASNIP